MANPPIQHPVVDLSSGLPTRIWSAYFSTSQTSGGAATDHGTLTGLADDDHPQYHNNARGDARYVQTAALSESIDDRVAALLVAGTNITLTYNDGAGTLTIDAASGGGGTGNTYFPSGW